MSENTVANQLVAEALAAAENDPHQDKDSMARALLNAVLAEMLKYRDAKDVISELNYMIENLDEDEFVITRGC